MSNSEREVLQVEKWKAIEALNVITGILNECRDELEKAIKEEAHAEDEKETARCVLYLRELEMKEERERSSAWSSYKEFRAERNRHIASLKEEREKEDSLEKKRSVEALEATQDGLMEEALELKAESEQHRLRCSEIDVEIESAVQEIRNARAATEAEHPIDTSKYTAAKAADEEARRKYLRAQEERLKRKIEFECIERHFKNAEKKRDKAERKLRDYLDAHPEDT